MVVLAAAGNDGQLLTSANFHSPSSYGPNYQGVISVGSVDTYHLDISSFSQLQFDLCRVCSSWVECRGWGRIRPLFPGDAYGYKQGTSMATPVAAGAAALAIGLLRSRGGTITASAIESYLMASGNSWSVLKRKN